MTRTSQAPYWPALGISMGAGLGVLVSLLLGWGGGGIALGIAGGAGIGLLVGAIAAGSRRA